MGLNVGESATTRAAQLLETCTRNGRGIKLDYRVKVEQSENLKNLVLFRNKYFVNAIQSSPLLLFNSYTLLYFNNSWSH